MSWAEEGKLLARAAVFLSPWGSGADHRAGLLCVESLFAIQKEMLRIVRPVLIFGFAPIRVREKRMNTHKTAKTPQSYQKVHK